ncbi:MAG: 6-phosphofructokinase [Verrucomicrobia bacterium]|nr:6-phosphofructokinase [Verrucomicrobiota bacterium]
MSEDLVGNVLVGQSGGPTAVINASLAGVISEALNHVDIEEIYGCLNGVLGILHEDLIDLAAESQQTIRGLKFTPGAALGTCRYKLKKQADFDRVLEVFKAHNIRYFFYAGGNDSQDTADKISKLAQAQGYALRVIGIPKTIDNDLVSTDHTPGYGSVIKYISTTIREIACDNAAMGQHDLVQIVEVMGRNAGWIAAGSALAKRREQPHDAPHLIYLPEVAFSAEKFVADVQRVLKREKFCLVVVGEGLVDADGNYVAAADKTDAFGHAQLGGAAEYLQGLVEQNLPGIKARTVKLGMAQRAAAHIGSKTDAEEAYLAGQMAVKAAIRGETDKMVTLLRGDNEHYTVETGLAPLSEIANGVKKLPREWISEDGVSMNHQFLRYATPLIQGETQVTYENGLPAFARLDKVSVDKVLPAYEA